MYLANLIIPERHFSSIAQNEHNLTGQLRSAFTQNEFKLIPFQLKIHKLLNTHEI